MSGPDDKVFDLDDRKSSWILKLYSSIKSWNVFWDNFSVLLEMFRLNSDFSSIDLIFGTFVNRVALVKFISYLRYQIGSPDTHNKDDAQNKLHFTMSKMIILIQVDHSHVWKSMTKWDTLMRDILYLKNYFNWKMTQKMISLWLYKLSSWNLLLWIHRPSWSLRGIWALVFRKNLEKNSD